MTKDLGGHRVVVGLPESVEELSLAERDPLGVPPVLRPVPAVTLAISTMILLVGTIVLQVST